MRFTITTWLGVAAVLAALVAPPAKAQSAPTRVITTASTNATILRPSKAVLHVLLPINPGATLAYLKLYNKSTAPVCGTDTPVWTVPIPFGSGSSGGGISLPSADGLLFSSGLGICVTGALADSDTSNAPAGIVLNFGVGGN